MARSILNASAEIWVTLSESVSLSRICEGTWELRQGPASTSFRLIPGSTLDGFVSDLSAGGFPLARWEDEVKHAGSTQSKVLSQLENLWRAGALSHCLYDAGQRVALVRGSACLAFASSSVDDNREYTLTEDVLIRKDCGKTLLESVPWGFVLELHSPDLFPLCAMLLQAASVISAADQLACEKDTIGVLFSWLGRMRLLREARSQPSRKTHLGWSFADRLFHARTRLGSHIGGYGATFPLRGTVAPPPAMRASSSTHSVKLRAPNLENSKASNPSFISVLEGRRSVREFSDAPITLDELSELLFLSVRTKRTMTIGDLEVASRPYPSGGGLYELEFYLLANQCSGLDPAVWRYNGSDHSLDRVADLEADAQGLLRDAKRSAPIEGEIQILLVISARFQRINWKYESIAYALVLKHVGVVFQTMYLVATAMGLGVCALGGGDSHRFSRLIHTDFAEESSVGEMLIGRPRPPAHL